MSEQRRCPRFHVRAGQLHALETLHPSPVWSCSRWGGSTTIDEEIHVTDRMTVPEAVTLLGQGEGMHQS